ncbi:hypothetical protein RIF29_21471 [Crotalaria pallida]|uniref:Uncharacterized protein n=1 Tax=Crotalaria pallida TaxID=3830 RepID=A0AAN9I5Z4_CROPI
MSYLSCCGLLELSLKRIGLCFIVTNDLEASCVLLYSFNVLIAAMVLWKYNDIAKYGYAAMGRSKITAEKGSSQNDSTTVQNEQHQVKRPSGLGGVMIGIGEQVYSILLLSVFFLEVYATGFIPYIGKVLNFVLLSWMYAYYCFEFSANFYYKLV